MERRGIAILGSTGSIGKTTLEVIGAHPDRFRVVALTANKSADTLLEQARNQNAELAVLADDDSLPAERVDGCRLACGTDAVLEAATHPDVEIVVNGLVGAAGLEPTLVALEGGKRVALANKESLVVGGPLVMRALAEKGGELIPVDSEHSAVFQCLQGSGADAVRRLVLTASGGPFRDRDPAELVTVTPKEALRHPTWDMGAKITIDSATLVNKALEVVEAHFLFGVPYERVDVVIHPQSIVHSLVEFDDGSVLAQLGYPTMAIPVLYALTYPERLPYPARSLDLAEVGSLSFESVAPGRFPAFELGCEAARSGGTAPAAFNAASEAAVAAFLDGKLPFTGIAQVIGDVLDRHEIEEVTSLEVVRRVDSWAREAAAASLKAREPMTGRKR
ncbi:MAG: 1-deoxy-D-xylulose-5-phosphate reductoisomerase [Gemmatimonadetes bacterium]|uniref:1-deoxy-D-xylulose 5-phosphate reductoisomerase n=1 Tax=Candidatus Kutchimonas denitrificans TaxID=3056748 RepID=A0AAE4Z9T3_9BACT|nr:1-deoxy-D-xylulose-5-phosphate reductoisomerase [Gemmatimonadota bacterium]NIR76238.1 1-deoxy-D-xylulose-5-phosphate reductoisomerase [Candidatus Kutchimonas denitrificans]NIS00678.1 1-deoxy-D-xylulose-5-phosphate reductoisomerase [Gemmatimonadota bacterium]NIT66823.1 1-deoxy-D-xylulose-5-phosphate reductoisomerase [Gemmatimonadota bacterium]NIV23422.1 1-deoxy-D-xylulose-5-phosphate reductoisomerase [Gemmatimonadota bacterium]